MDALLDILGKPIRVRDSVAVARANGIFVGTVEKVVKGSGSLKVYLTSPFSGTAIVARRLIKSQVLLLGAEHDTTNYTP